MVSAGTPRVAILGLGVMGKAFARRASGAGLDVIGWDRSSGTPPSQAVRAADVVVTIVYDGAAVIDVMQDALPAMKCGAVWLQMSTIGIEATERTIELAATRSDVGFLDAPVSDGQLVSTWALDKFAKIVESRTGDVEVPLRLAHKNVMLALSASAGAQPHLPILNRIASVWAEIVPTHGGNDITALYEHL